MAAVGLTNVNKGKSALQWGRNAQTATIPKHVDQNHTKKQYFGRLPSADGSDSEESSRRIVVRSSSLIVYQLRSTFSAMLRQGSDSIF